MHQCVVCVDECVCRVCVCVCVCVDECVCACVCKYTLYYMYITIVCHGHQTTYLHPPHPTLLPLHSSHSQRRLTALNHPHTHFTLDTITKDNTKDISSTLFKKNLLKFFFFHFYFLMPLHKQTSLKQHLDVGI